MYAKEMIKPKLHQLDQEKLARLYSDLRRESLATGSFPITVRHLESMIRMAEASAKMNLREYVRSDDIDLAIQVTVGSFVNAQKGYTRSWYMSLTIVPHSQGFRKYVHKATDHAELLAFLLGQLVKEKVQLVILQRGQEPASVEIPLSQLEARVSIRGVQATHSSWLTRHPFTRPRRWKSSTLPASCAPNFSSPTATSTSRMKSKSKRCSPTSTRMSFEVMIWPEGLREGICNIFGLVWESRCIANFASCFLYTSVTDSILMLKCVRALPTRRRGCCCSQRF
jgi:hypothetical protein